MFPLVAEFGFSDIKELITDQISLMIQAEIDHYEAEDRLYASRFGQPYEHYVASLPCGTDYFADEDTLNDWRFLREAIEIYRIIMQALLNA